MPKSRRSKLVTLTQTSKKTREDREKIGEEIHECLDKYTYVWVFNVNNMRNTFLKDIRQDWKGSRILYGRTRVMQKAFGRTPEEEYKENLSQLAKLVVGDVGLLLTNEKPDVVQEYFESFVKKDYARAGLAAPLTFTVPEGVVYATGGNLPVEEDVPMVHSMETTLRGLGMPTILKAGKVILGGDFTVCKEGQTLDGKQTRLLKHFGIAVSTFKVNLIASYSSETNEVTELA
ncbi:hypothetical protein NADFUDRAFT_31013 [Nadsonia fulvescens var. elongata DSM 6958]|uniref:Ribosome assembly factor mrt4 n=1 Tax=Nadsonia fulvescens var. elongata DSM 6958 TaxID=857566 RepID=A0A1E3PT08_9ASCO|nr:hypothetical protein NADFUDRAFT_31013 [Nadsonia fulvescens var. elongata DSM 6958]